MIDDNPGMKCKDGHRKSVGNDRKDIQGQFGIENAAIRPSDLNMIMYGEEIWGETSMKK